MPVFLEFEGEIYGGETRQAVVAQMRSEYGPDLVEPAIRELTGTERIPATRTRSFRLVRPSR